MNTSNSPDNEVIELRHQHFRPSLTCSFEQIEEIFDDCMDEAIILLSDKGVNAYLKGASIACMIGRGVEPVLVFLEEVPQIAKRVGEEIIPLISDTVWEISRSPNGNAIPNFIQSLPEASRRLGSMEQMQHYIDLIFDMAERTSKSVHDNKAMYPSPGLTDLLERIPFLLSQLSIEGLRNWVEYGIRNYNDNPDRQRDFFTLQSADSRAMFQKERHGTLFMDSERQLGLYLQGLWLDKEQLVPYSEGWDELRKPIPYYDGLGLRVPDVFDDTETVLGIDRYRAVLAHMAAHRRWTTPIVVDNFSPFQRISVELLEDSRVEYLAMQEYPGLKKIWTNLHPIPQEDACDKEVESCIRHRLAMLSYAIINPEHNYQNKDIIEFSQRFHDAMAEGESSTKAMASIAVSFIARTRRQEDQLPKIYFKDTEISYRDDNRHMWIYIEESDDEEQFNQHEELDNPEDINELPPRHYPEWDYKSQTFRPDWTSVYESLHRSGNPAEIDRILAKHESLAKRLKQILDMLKPQNFVRVRYQEEGSELDLDVAIRSLIDFKSGANPDPRINMSHKHDGRDIAVTLLIDLSASVRETPKGCSQSILELSREAVTLLSWAIERLGDPFSIGGFFSNTRHEVRYFHLKGFSEHFDDEVKGRLAAMDAGLSTRMGAAMRHAGHYLENQTTDKKLLLVLTDGEPADIDVSDEKLLIKDAQKAVGELDQQGIYTYCISLDPHADEYVSDIFGQHYSVIDNVQRLPEKLPELFVSLTK